MRILKNARVLTMNDGPVLLDADVCIEDGKIAEVVSRGSVTEKIGDVTEDLSGCVLMPGLFDCHVHYDQSFMADFFLAAGVTAVRNMSGNAEHARWRDETLSGERFGPYIYSGSPIVDGEDPTIPDNDNVIIRTREDAEKVIAYTKAHGFLWMKTYPSIEPELYHYLMKRCTEEGLPLCGHMTKRMSHRDLVAEGYICCEHTSSLPSDAQEIRKIAEMGIWLCPTHVVCETMPDFVWGGKRLTDIEHFEDLPEYVREKWESSNRVIIEAYHKHNIHPDFNQIIERGTTFMKYSSPDRIMAGSDCAYPGMVPGFALHDELERLVRVYGMTNYQALSAATRNPAAHIGIADRKGRILPGMDADLIALEGNPLENIGAVKALKKVWQGKRSWTAAELLERVRADRTLKPEDVEIIVRKGGSPDEAL